MTTAVLLDFRAELARIVEGGRLGVHLRRLRHSLRGDRPDLRGLLRYGVSRLPHDDTRPDDALAAFFIVVSELEGASPELRVFAAKCVEYCESEVLDGWSSTLPQLHAAYRALLHQLDEASAR